MNLKHEFPSSLAFLILDAPVGFLDLDPRRVSRSAIYPRLIELYIPACSRPPRSKLPESFNFNAE